MALSKCKECDKEISDKAKTCPHCGSPVPQPMGLVSKLVLGLFVIGVIGSVVSGGSNPSSPSQQNEVSKPSPAPALTQPESVLTVTSIQLTKAYEDNEAAADAAYKDKILDITGSVTRIDKNITDDIVLDLRGVNSFMGVSATLQKDENQKATTLKKGQKITVRCLGMGEVIGSPIVDRCIILSKSQ